MLCHMTPCFNDWRRFCFVLREIASGKNGMPLADLEAQRRARAVLVECGYTWPGRTVAPEPIAAADMLREPENDLKKPREPENELKKPPRMSKRGTR
jgi:hypothetical protein